ncbi:Uncharacterized protein CGCS363_v012067 [Colletotrichum siamense]|uniref:Uncharacterized protein n=1 Tax=Colletotrichum siamense TaxID=690259 RepID=UPI001873178D|nr:Uncharacterized protein CGCS363_v012067 [Colletotrichum siamense]KAF5490082.1 Uncharacterized protein CGCS363_v012067 [Colletotrichum siamense]
MSTEDIQTEAYQRELEVMRTAPCHPLTPGFSTNYGYVPSFAAGVALSVLFSIPLFYHTFQSIRLRATVSILLAIGALSWVSRAYAGKCPYNADAFMSQIVTLIIAPVFFASAIYVLLGKLIINLGPSSSSISPKWYIIVFCTCDVLALIIQAIGGAMASIADTDEDMSMGSQIMLGGIAVQLFTMTLFGGFLGDFFWRVFSHVRGSVIYGMKLVFVSLTISFVMVYIRSVYRVIELAQGWNGYFLTHEVYFIALDAVVMVIAVAIFVPLDPAVILGREGLPGFSKKMREKRSVSNGEVPGE